MPWADLLEALFAGHGYRVTRDVALEGRSGAVFEVPLLCEGPATLVVTCEEEAGAEEVAGLAALAQDCGADTGLLCLLGPGPAPAAGEGAAVWTRAQLERHLGALHLAHALGEEPAPLDLGAPAPPPAEALPESLSDLLPSAFQDLGPMLEPIAEEVASLDAQDGPGPATEAWTFAPPPSKPSRWNPWAEPVAAPPQEEQVPPPAFSSQPQPASWPAVAPLWSNPTPAPPAAPALLPVAEPGPPLPPLAMPGAPVSLARPAPAPNGKPQLPARLSDQDARRKVKEKLFSVDRVEVVWHPVHLFDYEVDLLKEGSLASDTVDGRIQVHGCDKGVADVDPDATNPEAPSKLPPGHGFPATERVVRIPEERARELAFRHVATRHTRSVEVRVPDHNNSLYYTERRKVEPTAGQVRLTYLGLHLRPAWRLHGRNGQVDLDAIDGRELFSEVRGGRTDSVLLD